MMRTAGPDLCGQPFFLHIFNFRFTKNVVLLQIDRLFLRNMKDDLLTDAFRKGDQRAFRRFFTHWYAKVWGFALKMTGQDWAADEIAQNVFCKIWAHRETIADMDSGNVSGYIFTITRNEVMDWFRSRKQMLKFQQEFVMKICEESHIEDKIDSGKALSIINKTVSSMPPVRRQVFIMSRYRHLTNSEIAAILGISRRTVEKHISISLAELRIVLSSQFF